MVYGAVTHVRQGGAAVATMRGVAHDRTRARLFAGAARLGAVTPASPCRDIAMDRALISVTWARLLECAAERTAVRGFGHDRANARGRTTVAGLGACAPAAPDSHVAVLGAAVLIARTVLLKRWAWRTTMHGWLSHPARAREPPTSTAFVAARVIAPARDPAIEDARLRVAGTPLLVVAARQTSVSSLPDDRAIADLHAAAACRCRARSPCGPRASDAVHGARAHGAGCPVGQRWAYVAAVLGVR